MAVRDSIYANRLSRVDDFTFDERVAAVFPDMIKRSVPGYSTVIAMTGVLAGQYARENTRCYDLGCSLGESSFSMCTHLDKVNCSIVAVDNSSQMLDRCKVNLKQGKCSASVELVCDDILNIDINNASVVVLNYTLQFVDSSRRDELIKSIFEGLIPGGILLLSEKIKFDDPDRNQRMIDMHHEFKKANGYSDLEISQKRTALENVLIPETLERHQNRLFAAGFYQSDLWFECFNFISLIAYKSGS